MFRNLFLSLVLFLFLVQPNFSQTVETNPLETNKKDEISVELRKESVGLLRETSVEVNSLRTLENRISFSAELASLMWFNDEKEARTMFQTVINDFRQLLTEYDAQLTSFGIAPEMADVYSTDSSQKTQITRKFFKAISVRQQIAKAIAEHDPQLAFEFFTDTATAISNPTFRKQMESSDAYFETRLLNSIAEKNVDAALKLGRKTLAKGFNYELISLLKKIYEKDEEKGASFAEDIVSKLKSESSKPDGFYYLSRVLNTGVENLDAIKAKPNKRPMFSDQSLRDLAELLAQEILKREDAENSEISSYLNDIERFLPARAAQIRQKFDIKKKKASVNSRGSAVVANSNGKLLLPGEVPPPPPPPVAPSVSVKSGEDSKKKLADDLQNLDIKKLSDDERKKVVEESRKIIAETVDRDQKLLALSALALRIAKLGDKELASVIMKDAQNLVNLQPKNYREYIEIWMLVGGYAQVDAEKAFSILETTVFRLNDTISAFVKVGEFIDVSGEMIDDGEIQVGSFGGEMTRGMLGSLGTADSTVRSLAAADFARIKSLTNRFERQEVRILTKMLILRAVLASKSEVKEEF
ncbi:MAG: hypothetical protein M3R14_09605 [Acidobacteriota bacterium]|nr:hypothetical protein [Acidobacteriota bacterium]